MPAMLNNVHFAHSHCNISLFNLPIISFSAEKLIRLITIVMRYDILIATYSWRAPSAYQFNSAGVHGETVIWRFHSPKSFIGDSKKFSSSVLEFKLKVVYLVCKELF